jgi:hypothetical protein
LLYFFEASDAFEGAADVTLREAAVVGFDYTSLK